MRKRVRLSAALHALAGVLAACCLARAEAFQAGVCIHVGQNRNPTEATRSALEKAGLALRDEVFWHRLETRPGALEYPASLADLESLVNDAVRRGQKPLLILDYGNKAYDGGDLISSEAGLSAYARYVRFVVHHFKGRVSQYEVWNEWNIGLGSPAKPRHLGSGEAYVSLLKAAYQAIKAEDPTATVIGGAVAGVDEHWVDAFGRAGGFAWLDAFSVHPYNYQQPRFLPEDAIESLDGLKKTIDGFAPGKNLALYVTEMGWPTHLARTGVSEPIAGAYLQRFLLLARSRPWIAGVWWYDLFDDGDDPHDKENRFGLLARGGQPKAAFQALLAIRPFLDPTTELAVTQGPADHVNVSGRTRDGKRFLIAWLATGNFSRGAPFPEAAKLLQSGYRPTDPYAGAQDPQRTAAPQIWIER